MDLHIRGVDREAWTAVRVEAARHNLPLGVVLTAMIQTAVESAPNALALRLERSTPPQPA